MTEYAVALVTAINAEGNVDYSLCPGISPLTDYVRAWVIAGALRVGNPDMIFMVVEVENERAS